MAADVGNGTTISFATSAFSANWISLDSPEMVREAIETSHLGTTGSKTFLPGDLVDNGEISGQIQFDASTDPPIDGAVEVITITYPDTSTWAMSGFMTSYKGASCENDTLMAADVKIKITGDITITAA